MYAYIFTVIILIAIELCIPIHICTYVCMYLYCINKDLPTGHGCIFIRLSNIADKTSMGVNYVYIRMYYFIFIIKRSVVVPPSF